MSAVLIHNLLCGQELGIAWRNASHNVLANLRKLRLAPPEGNLYASAWVTFVDKEGLSAYIVRGRNYGGDMEVLLRVADVNWRAYFEPYDNYNMSYVKTRHFEKQFPLDFLSADGA